MKRCGLDVATLLTVLLTAFVLTKAGWFAAARSAPPRRATVGGAKALSPYASEAAARFRRCQPTHWRACMLQH
jgi:hypothetical protein